MQELILDIVRLILEKVRDSGGAAGATALSSEADGRRIDARHYYQLTGCVTQYTSVNLILWTIFSIFAAAHALLVTALVTSLGDQGKIIGDHPHIAVWLSLVGLLAAFAWALLLRRTIGHLVWHQKLVERIEASLGIEPQYQMFPARLPGREPGQPDTSRLPMWGYGPPAKIVMQICSGLTALGWLCVLIYFLRC